MNPHGERIGHLNIKDYRLAINERLDFAVRGHDFTAVLQAPDGTTEPFTVVIEYYKNGRTVNETLKYSTDEINGVMLSVLFGNAHIVFKIVKIGDEYHLNYWLQEI